VELVSLLVLFVVNLLFVLLFVSHEFFLLSSSLLNLLLLFLERRNSDLQDLFRAVRRHGFLVLWSLLLSILRRFPGGQQEDSLSVLFHHSDEENRIVLSVNPLLEENESRTESERD
jgi:hypothetical protein